MKATLKINDKEIEVDITEEELKKLEEKKPRKRWRAAAKNIYWYIISNGSISNDIDISSEMDDKRYSIGNYFKTEEEAELYKNELIYTQMLKDYIYEHDDVKFDWNDAKQDKYYLLYDFCNEEIECCLSWSCKFPGAICASNSQVLKDAVKFIGEENVKKYILKVQE